MQLNKDDIHIFGLTQGIKLAKEICDLLGITKQKIKTTRFADGEILTEILDSVRGKEIYLIQSTSQPVNESLMELLIAIDAFKRNNVEKINIIMPYYGYARQDCKAKGRQPITSKLVANIITKAGANRIITVDIHSLQSIGFFDIPIDNFYTAQILANEIIEIIDVENLNPVDCILVSPDYGGIKRVNEVKSYVRGVINETALISKYRPKPNVSKVEFVLGDIKNKHCFIIDDIIDTGGTILNAAKILKKNGAKNIYVFACHGLFNGQAKVKLVNAISQGIVKKVIVTNTIQILEDCKFDELKIISVAPLLAEMIKALVNNKSLSEVYNYKKQKIYEKSQKIINKYKK